MIVLYLAVAVVMLTLGINVLSGNVKRDLRGPELMRIPIEPNGDQFSDR
jgi:hypothetical protein